MSSQEREDLSDFEAMKKQLLREFSDSIPHGTTQQSKFSNRSSQRQTCIHRTYVFYPSSESSKGLVYSRLHLVQIQQQFFRHW